MQDDSISLERSARTAPSDRSGMIGRRLRAERHRQHIGLRELAKRVGISPSLLSQIETGKTQPSVGTLYAIANELDLSLDLLFSESAEPRPRAASDHVVGPAGSPQRSAPLTLLSLVQRADTRRSITLESGVHWERLTATADPLVEFLYVTYEVGSTSSPAEVMMRHPGREYGIVLSGHLGVAIQFDTYELGPGDSIAFDSTLPHRLWCIGPQPVQAVWFVVGHSPSHQPG